MSWCQNTQTLIGKVCLKSEPCYENIMETLWKYYENIWKPSVYSLPWSDSLVARSYFITAEKPWKHISLKFKGLQILVHSTVGKIQQQKHATIVLKNKTEIIKNQQALAKNIKNHETNEIWSDSSTLGPYLASDTQTVIAPSSISQDLGPIRECLQIRQRLETNEIWMRFEWDLSRNFCDFSHFRSL